MGKSYKKIVRKLLLVFTLIAIATHTFEALDHWSLINEFYYNTFYILMFCSNIGIIGSLLSLLFPHIWKVVIPIVLIIWTIIYIGQCNPIDCEYFPKDIKIIKTDGKKKVVLRKHLSAKTGYSYLDTCIVEDYWCFRKIY